MAFSEYMKFMNIKNELLTFDKIKSFVMIVLVLRQGPLTSPRLSGFSVTRFDYTGA